MLYEISRILFYTHCAFYFHRPLLLRQLPFGMPIRRFLIILFIFVCHSGEMRRAPVSLRRLRATPCDQFCWRNLGALRLFAKFFVIFGLRLVKAG